MMTVHEVSRISGVSIRALHIYDRNGLLPATEVTDAGYRLYDEAALERLQEILLFKELQFPLREIREILDSPGFDRKRALEDQIRLLELRREHLDELINLARGIKDTGVKDMRFDAFDTKKIDRYAAEAKERWGGTEAYREFEQKSAGRSKEDGLKTGAALMDIFREFGTIREADPASPEAKALAERLQTFISENYYSCTDDILLSLGRMYAAGGEFTENIDACGGPGTADFACRAIEAMVRSREE